MSHSKLVNVVEKAPSREWMDRYFDLMAELIEVAQVSRDDERLLASIKNDNTLNTSISQRICLKAYPTKEQVGAIMPHDSAAVEKYEQANGEKPYRYSGSDRPDPYFIEFSASSPDEFFILEYKDDWRHAIKKEAIRRYRRKRDDAHEPVVYKAATEPDYRQDILNKAF